MIGRAAILLAVASLAWAAPLPAADSTALAPQTWQRAIGPWAWSFPRDHGAHPNFKTEWWYFTGNLKDQASGQPFGYQLTIFRQGIQFEPAQPHSQWAARDFYFGHFTVSDIASGQFHFAEKVSRGALGEAHAATDKMDVALGTCRTRRRKLTTWSLRMAAWPSTSSCIRSSRSCSRASAA
jgi:predicted secreted hydrolase